MGTADLVEPVLRANTGNLQFLNDAIEGELFALTEHCLQVVSVTVFGHDQVVEYDVVLLVRALAKIGQPGQD